MKTPLPRPFIAVLAALLLGVASLPGTASAAPAARGTPPASLAFSESVLAERRPALGLDKLSPAETSALNALVAREVRLAREGNVQGFAGTFVSRRTPEERQQAGLDRLTPGQQGQLNNTVAARLSERPVVGFAYVPKSSDSSGANGSGVLVGLGPKPEIHGEVSLTYGWGSGDRSFKAGSMLLTYDDPQRKFNISFLYSVIDGDGWFGHPGYYSGGYGPYGRYGHRRYDPLYSYDRFDDLDTRRGW